MSFAEITVSKLALSLLALVPVFGCALAAERAPVVIPLELRDRYPFLTATVGDVDVKLKFDLGDRSALVLQEDTLERIVAIPTGETSRFQGVDGAFESPQFKVSRLQLGGVTFADVVTTMDAARKGYDPDPLSQGLLGTGLLKSYELVIDYAQRTLTLGATGSCKGIVVPFDRSSPKWHAEPVTKSQIDIVQGPVMLWWDTGAPVSALRKSLTLPLMQSSEIAVTTKRLQMGTADFGPWQFDVWDMDLPGFDGFLGYDFFIKHVVCVDFPGNRIVIGS